MPHYPLAIAPMIQKALDRARSNPSVYTEVVGRIGKAMSAPVCRYRPLPQALRFHKSGKRFRFCLGGNRCLGADTVIESPDGDRRVADIDRLHHVWAWNGSTKVKAQAEVPFIKAFEPMFSVHFSNGNKIECTLNHRMLTVDGWRSLHAILSTALLPQQKSVSSRLSTTSGIGPSAPDEDDLRWTQIEQDFQFDYPSCFYFYDAPLHWDEDNDLVLFPLLNDVPTHNPPTYAPVWHKDVPGNTQECSPTLKSNDHLSSSDAPSRSEGRLDALLCRAERIASRFSDLPYQAGQQPIDGFYPLRSIYESCQSAMGFHVSKPCLVSCKESGTPISIIAISPLGVKPVYDFEVPGFGNYCAAGIVHHNSSKSHAVAHEVWWYARGTHPWKTVNTPNVGWYCTQNWELVGTILMEKLDMLMQGTDAYVAVWHNKSRSIPGRIAVPTPNGESQILLKAYEQRREAFQGTDRRYIANDEQFPQDIYIEQISRVGPNEPLDFFTALTPVKPQPWLEERLTVDIPDAWDVFYFPLDDNRISRGGFIDDVTIDGLIEEWPEEVQPTRREGKWGSFMGVVYKSFNRATHVVSEEEEKKVYFPPGIFNMLRCIGGLDFGANNPFVYLWAVRIPHLDNDWYIFDEYYWNPVIKGDRLLRQHAETILSNTKKWGLSLSATWADHDRQDRVDMHGYGLSTLPAIKDILEGIETVQTYLKPHGPAQRPRLHIAARCTNTIREMSTYHWPEGTDTNDPKELPVGVDDHCADATRYIIHSEHVGNMHTPIPSLGKMVKRRF